MKDRPQTVGTIRRVSIAICRDNECTEMVLRELREMSVIKVI
jgi:hypothetical protein